MFSPIHGITVGMLVAWLCVTQTAYADPGVQTQAAENGDYSFRFSDENLLGGTLNGAGDLYGRRPKAARVMLLRPRVSLIQEIVKSVENL